MQAEFSPFHRCRLVIYHFWRPGGAHGSSHNTSINVTSGTAPLLETSVRKIGSKQRVKLSGALWTSEVSGRRLFRIQRVAAHQPLPIIHAQERRGGALIPHVNEAAALVSQADAIADQHTGRDGATQWNSRRCSIISTC